MIEHVHYKIFGYTHEHKVRPSYRSTNRISHKGNSNWDRKPRRDNICHASV